MSTLHTILWIMSVLLPHYSYSKTAQNGLLPCYSLLASLTADLQFLIIRLWDLRSCSKEVSQLLPGDSTTGADVRSLAVDQRSAACACADGSMTMLDFGFSDGHDD